MYRVCKILLTLFRTSALQDILFLNFHTEPVVHKVLLVFSETGRLATSRLAECFSRCFKISLNVFKIMSAKGLSNKNKWSLQGSLASSVLGLFLFHTPSALILLKKIQRNFKTSRKKKCKSSCLQRSDYFYSMRLQRSFL